MKVVEQLAVMMGVWLVLGGVAGVGMGRWLAKVSRCYPEAERQDR